MDIVRASELVENDRLVLDDGYADVLEVLERSTDSTRVRLRDETGLIEIADLPEELFLEVGRN